MRWSTRGKRRVRLVAQASRGERLAHLGVGRVVYVVVMTLVYAGMVLYSIAGDGDPHTRFRDPGDRIAQDHSTEWQFGPLRRGLPATGFLIYSTPSKGHWLGTDENGRDMFVRMAHSGRTSLIAGLIALVAYLSVGTALGTAAGYLEGRWQQWVSHLEGVVSTFPILLMLLLSVIIVDSSMPERWLFLRGFALMFLLGLYSSPKLAALIQGRIASLKKAAFIEAASALGLHPLKIVLKHVLWLECRPVIVVQAAYMMGQALLVEVTLTYLNAGLEYPIVSWGLMLRTMTSGLLTRKVSAYILLTAMVALVYYFHMLAGILNDALRTERQE